MDMKNVQILWANTLVSNYVLAQNGDEAVETMIRRQLAQKVADELVRSQLFAVGRSEVQGAYAGTTEFRVQIAVARSAKDFEREIDDSYQRGWKAGNGVGTHNEKMRVKAALKVHAENQAVAPIHAIQVA